MSEIADALRDTLISPNVPDRNLESANIVDAIAHAASAISHVANAITPRDAVGGKDSYGGHIESLTEAAMSIGRGLSDIADAIRELATSVDSINSER